MGGLRAAQDIEPGKLEAFVEEAAVGEWDCRFREEAMPVAVDGELGDSPGDGEVALVFNTTEGWQSLKDSHSIRATALARKVPYFTTAAASLAAARSIEAVRGHALEVASLQSYYPAS